VFLTVAEERHFGRSAERLQINRSRVSQIISALEVKVGGRLFVRTSRRVTMTPWVNACHNLAHPYGLLQRRLQRRPHSRRRRRRNAAGREVCTRDLRALLAPVAGRPIQPRPALPRCPRDVRPVFPAKLAFRASSGATTALILRRLSGSVCPACRSVGGVHCLCDRFQRRGGHLARRRASVSQPVAEERPLGDQFCTTRSDRS
jgi:Bacterial regulatory helix-turn-helix protein, lysR family